MYRILFLSVLLVFLLSIPKSFAQSLNWVRPVGGLLTENTVSLTVDLSANLYDVTNFSGLITLTSGQSFSSTGREDILLRKYSPSGLFTWAKKIGGSQTDLAYSLTSDRDNNTYVGGTFQDTLRIESQAILLAENLGTHTGFILKFNRDGVLIWARAFNTTGTVVPNSLSMNHLNNLVISGYFEGSADFDPSSNSNSLTSNGGSDMFISTFTPNGELIWVKRIGGSESEFIYEHSLNNVGEIYLTGQYQQVLDFDSGVGEHLAFPNGGTDIFILKLSLNGDFIWVKSIGGVGFDAGLGIDIGPDQNLVCVGRFTNQVDFNPALLASFNLTSAGSWDGFAVKLDPNGDFIWATKIGDTQNDQFSTVHINPQNIIYIGGVFRGTVDFNLSSPVGGFSTSFGGADIFNLMLNEDGTYNNHTTIGGLGNEQINKILAANQNFILSVGSFSGTVDFDPSPQINNSVSAGNTDGFVLSLFICAQPFIKNIISTKDQICRGEEVTLSVVGGQLNGASQWTWSQASCNAPSFASGVSVTGSILQNTEFFLKGTGGCTINPACKSKLITVFADSIRNQLLTICSGDSIMVGTNVYKNQGLYLDTLTSVSGCDSVIFTNLIVNPVFEVSQEFTICAGEIIMVGNISHSSPGTYIDVLTSVNGCDSVVTTVLNVIPIDIINQDVFLCQGDNYVVGDSTYNETGTYLNSVISMNGCENFIITNLTVVPFDYNIEHRLCMGDSILIGGTYYYSSLIVVEFLGSSLGCDSIVNHNVIFSQSTTTNRMFRLCAGDSLMVGNNVYTNSGTYRDTLLNISGCDSILVSNVIFFQKPAPVTRNIAICEGQSVQVGNKIYFLPGNYVDTIVNLQGCDSVIFTNLTVYPSFTQVSISLCFGDSLKVGNKYYTKSGVYTDVLISSLGCDSTATNILTIRNPITSTLNGSICEGEQIVFNGVTYSMQGTYQQKLIAANGCDSIVILNLNVINKSFEQSISICEGDSLVIGNNVYFDSGSYIDTLNNALGCDSVMTTNLTVRASSYASNNFTICNGKSVQVGGSVYSTTGTYIDVLTNYLGCDSIVQTMLTVEELQEIYIEKTICDGDIFILGNKLYSVAGGYRDIIKYANQCDTLVHLILSVTKFDPSITIDGNVISVEIVDNASYEWYDCSIGKVLIPGANTAKYSITKSGRYSVSVTIGECSFESDCVEVIMVSTKDQNQPKISFYPNPVHTDLNINSLEQSSYVIYNNLGQKLLTGDLEVSNNKINIQHFLPGLYFCTIQTKGKVNYTFMFVKF